MAKWAIGDVQGCLGALRRLLAAIEAQDADATFYFCGDLVNRGEDSLGTLLLIQSLAQQGRAHTVLGNHDLYALACAAGFLQPKPQDTFNELLAAPQLWVDWLRRQPLAIDIATEDGAFLLTHAGVWPAWSATQTLQLAQQVQLQQEQPQQQELPLEQLQQQVLLQQVFRHKQLKPMLIMQLIERNVSFFILTMLN